MGTGTTGTVGVSKNQPHVFFICFSSNLPLTLPRVVVVASIFLPELLWCMSMQLCPYWIFPASHGCQKQSRRWVPRGLVDGRIYGEQKGWRFPPLKPSIEMWVCLLQKNGTRPQDHVSFVLKMANFRNSDTDGDTFGFIFLDFLSSFILKVNTLEVYELWCTFRVWKDHIFWKIWQLQVLVISQNHSTHT